MTYQPEPPSWLAEPCPSWCAREHGESDHPDDRYHQSAVAVVPVIVSLVPTVPVTASFEAAGLSIRRCRYVGDTLEWVAVEGLEGPRPRLVLTLESARLFLPALADQLVAR